MERVIKFDEALLSTLQKTIKDQRERNVAEWKQHPLTPEQLQDHANLGKIQKQLNTRRR